MSIESSTLVWAHSRAEGSALLALLCIADHDGDGGSWPGMDTIAQRARVTRDTARKLVRRLETLGEIVTETNGGGGLRTANHMRTNRYEITIECPETCDRSGRHRERLEPVDNTPQPNGGAPSARRGAPQPNGGANHPLTTHLGNSEQYLVDLDTNDRVSNPNIEGGGNYTDWSPSESVAKSRKRMAELRAQENTTTTKPRYTPPPAPSIPRFDPSSIPTPPPRVDAEQRALNEQAQLITCPLGFGEGKNRMHWCPDVSEGCVRCGDDSQTIIDQANQLEGANQ